MSTLCEQSVSRGRRSSAKAYDPMDETYPMDESVPAESCQIMGEHSATNTRLPGADPIELGEFMSTASAVPITKGRHPMLSRRDQKRLEDLRRRKKKSPKMTRSGLSTTCGVKTQWGYCAAPSEGGRCARHYDEFIRKQSK